MSLGLKRATIAGRVSLAVTIPANQSLSQPANVGVLTLTGIILPAGWQTAPLSFQASADGVTWQEMYTAAGTDVSTGPLTGPAWVALNPSDFAGIQFLRIRSGRASAPVTQTAECTLMLILRSV